MAGCGVLRLIGVAVDDIENKTHFPGVIFAEM